MLDTDPVVGNDVRGVLAQLAQAIDRGEDARGRALYARWREMTGREERTNGSAALAALRALAPETQTVMSW